jgi:hypothetical protein
MKNISNENLIYKYLDHELNEEEEIEFNFRIENNPEFLEMLEDFADTEDFLMNMASIGRNKDREDFFKLYDELSKKNPADAFEKELINDEERAKTQKSRTLWDKHKGKFAIAASITIVFLAWLAPQYSKSLRVVNLIPEDELSMEIEKNDSIIKVNKEILGEKENLATLYQDSLMFLKQSIDSLNSIQPNQYLASNLNIEKFLMNDRFLRELKINEVLYAEIASDNQIDFAPFDCFKNNEILASNRFEIINNTDKKYKVEIFNNDGNKIYNFIFEPNREETLSLYIPGLYGIRINILGVDDKSINSIERIFYITDAKR